MVIGREKRRAPWVWRPSQKRMPPPLERRGEPRFAAHGAANALSMGEGPGG